MEPTAIHLLRLKLGETQASFAERLGVHSVSVSRWEAGNLSPDPDARGRLAVAAAKAGIEITGLGALVTLVALLGKSDPELEKHCQRVSGLAEQCGRALDVSPGELAIAGLIHDIGKSTIPPAILHHRGKLSSEEMLVIQGHVSSGAALAALVAGVNVARFVREHHERMDGKGYPAGLSGDEISMGGRILAVCDQFDARVESRGYRRKNHDREEVLLEMLRSPHLDAAAVEALRKVIREGARPPGRPRKDAAQVTPWMN